MNKNYTRDLLAPFKRMKVTHALAVYLFPLLGPVLAIGTLTNKNTRSTTEILASIGALILSFLVFLYLNWVTKVPINNSSPSDSEKK